ncbi:MAG: hypothetical protein SFW35_13045 [Chitinophagales bacterium]|nr:hypothetical protein [Chitinophagales bacterium]
MKYLLLLLACLPFANVIAQNKTDHPKVMIIPFDPDMYFNDSDEMLAKYNQKNIKEIRTMFRMGFNANLSAKILSEYETKSMLTDTTKDVAKDLYAIYKSISYFQDKSMPQQQSIEQGQTVNKSLFKKKPSGNDQTKSKLTETDKDGLHTYMNVKIHDVKMLEYLKQKYGTELFVFVNQFNLVTNYEHCLDRATNTFEREIGIHYSIFDYTGKQLAGDVAIIKFPSNTNDMAVIIKETFPPIADHLTKDLPGHIKSSNGNSNNHEVKYQSQPAKKEE